VTEEDKSPDPDAVIVAVSATEFCTVKYATPALKLEDVNVLFVNVPPV
jgi:hypothetical protein